MHANNAYERAWAAERLRIAQKAAAPRGPAPVMYIASLDLGQASDYTALSVVERTPLPDPGDPACEIREYGVRHLFR